MRDHFSDTNKIGLWFFPLNFRYVEKIFEGFKKKKTSRWCWNCRIYIIRVILKPGYGWLGMNKSCFVLSWNFWWVFWSNIFLDFFFILINSALLANILIMLIWFWIHDCAYLFTFWNSFWPMWTRYYTALIFQTMDDKKAFELGLKSEGNAFICDHKIGSPISHW